jgi:D-lactate dehydrogenase (cytochrome)
MRYGGVRDLVQALSVVMPDGRVIHAGRPVMKNVAGYDLVKLFTGSWGALGLITDVTFKLSPTPRAVRTLAVPVDSIAVGLDWGRRLLPQALVASTVMLLRGGPTVMGMDAPLSLVYTAEGLSEDVDAELLQVKSLLQMHGAPAFVELEGAGSELWAEWMGEPLAEPGASLVRAGMPVKALKPAIEALGLDAPDKARDVLLDLANGHLYRRGLVDLAAVRRVLDPHDGYAVVLRASDPSADLDRWGHVPGGTRMMDAIKARWDPQQRFNPDVFVV